MTRICNTIVGVVVALGIAGAVQSQDIWKRQSALPADRNPMGVAALSANRAVFVGDDKMILETTNAGASWTIHNLESTDQVPHYAVAFATPSIGIITDDNMAWRSTDGGTTWGQIANFPAGTWYHLDFVDANTGFAGGNGGCVATSDGGATWSVRAGYPDCPIMYGMDFRDANVGLAGGYSQALQDYGIFKTTDGGRTWVRKATTSANDVLWMSSNQAVADYSTTILRSIDAGETWQTVATGITSGIMSLARAGQSSVVIGVSGKGDVWRSADAGLTWAQTFDGPGALPDVWEVDFADELHGWVVGPGGFYFYTSDGGLTWFQKNSGCTAQVRDIQMLNTDYGLAVGQDGYVFRTINGGSFWDVQKLEVTGQVFGRDESLSAVDVVDSQFAVAAGPGGTVFKTTNGGLSWISIGFPTLPNKFWINDVDFIDANLGYVYGIDQDLGHTKTLYRTRNGGATWEWVYLGERGGGTTIQFLDAQRGWLTADNRLGLRTTDGGNTWTEFIMPEYFISPEVSKVRFLDASVGWVVGWDGYVAKTTNGGTSWNLLNIGTTTDHLYDVVPVSSSEVWMCGREDWSFAGVMYHSTNGGQSWTRQVVTDWFYFPYRLAALAGGDVWFGGFFGSIFRKEPTVQTIQPTAFRFERGRPNGGVLSDLFNSDDLRVSGLPALFYSAVTDPIELVVEGVSPLANPSSLEIQVECAVSPGMTTQRVQLWNFATSAWETIYTGNSTTTDSVVTASASGALARFVEPGTKQVRAKVRWRPGLFAVANWSARVDQLIWRVRP